MFALQIHLFLFSETNRKLEGKRAKGLQPMGSTGKEIRGEERKPQRFPACR